MKFFLKLVVIMTLAGCAANGVPKPYNNRYGGFDHKEDADCAFLVFQRDAKRELGDKWDEVYAECKRLSLAGTPLTPEIYNEIHRNPTSRNTANGVGTAFVALIGILAQAHQMEMQRQALEPDLPPPQPTTSYPSRTDCYSYGNTLSCRHH